MFDLENSIQNWKSSLYKNGAFEEGHITELESHLRDYIEGQINLGASEESAFTVAVQAIGTPGMIAQEVRKSRLKLDLEVGGWGVRLFYFINFLKLFIRKAKRNKLYTSIHIAGLSLGLASSLIIFLFVQHELSHDSFHHDKERIFRLIAQSDYPGGGIAKIESAMGPTLAEQLPEVESMTRLNYFGGAIFKVQDEKFVEDNGISVDPQFFDIFNFKTLAGNPSRLFEDDRKIVITNHLAQKYFSGTNPVGKAIQIGLQGKQYLYEVVAVVEDTPSNSHFDFDFIGALKPGEYVDGDGWTRMQAYTYFKLKENTVLEQVEESAMKVLLKHKPEHADSPRSDNGYQLQALTDIYLHSHLFRELGNNGDLTTVYTFSTLAIFMLLIAAINFINLATARAQDNTLEIGIRKTLGATKATLASRFLTESVLLCIISMIIAVLIAEAFLPYVHLMTAKELSIDYLKLIPILFVIPIALGLISGFYPALFLSSFQTIKVLKGKSGIANNSWLRKSLVVFQFVLSSSLAIGTAVIYNQMQYIQSKDLGMLKEGVVFTSLGSDLSRQNQKTLIHEIEKIPNVVSASYTGNIPGGGDWGLPFKVEGVEDADLPPIRALCVDDHFLETYGMTLVRGRNFSPQIQSDLTEAYIVNEAFANQMGWENPIGKQISIPGVGRVSGKIIGVVQDFHFRSLHEHVAPLVLLQNPAWTGTLSVRLAHFKDNNSLKEIAKICEGNDPDLAVDFNFFDQKLGLLYKEDQLVQSTVSLFAFLIIFVACIGLFGLAVHTVRRRGKEMSIRKVMGASSRDIFMTVASGFLKIISVAFLIAIPLAWYSANGWLENFAYRIVISPLTILTVWLAMLAVTLVTIGVQVVHIALVNPAVRLREE